MNATPDRPDRTDENASPDGRADRAHGASDRAGETAGAASPRGARATAGTSHRRRRGWIIAAVVVVVIAVVALIAGPKIYSSIESSDVAAPTLDTSAQDAADVSGTWTVGTGSYAGYRVGEELRGEHVDVVGRTENVTGTATVTDGTLTAGEVHVDLASVSTDSDRRDNYFRTKAIDSAAHPEAVFRITEPVGLGEVGGEAKTLSAPGELTLNGQTVQVTAELQVARTDAGLAVAGSVPMTWTQVGVEPPSMGFVEVEDSGQIEFELDLTH